MDPRAALITDVDTQLRHYLGQGVDVQRTLVDARYARDVLLVCDGMTGTDLPQLSRRFRQASQGVQVVLPVLRAAIQVDAPPPADAADNTNSAAGGDDAGPPQGWSRNTSGFGHSHPPIADFNLAPHIGTPNRALMVADGHDKLTTPPGESTAYQFGNSLPWYSWRRWWFTRRL